MIKNWKTTLAGALGGAFIAIQPLLATGEINYSAVITGFVIAFVSAFAKDFNITGK